MGLQGIDAAGKDTVGCSVYVPNVYLPNSEVMGQDIFTPTFACPPVKYEMWIFDRWGNVVFDTTDYTKGWDGKVNDNWSQIDTYVWKIKYMQQPGEKEQVLKGRFSLIR
jgi:gliding motility-associated-like protein